jgi:glycyl-tRNA synthetase beta chain
LREPEEKALFEAWQKAKAPLAAAIEKEDYAAAARIYHDGLAGPVHTFFEKVYVNVEENEVRANRLALLCEINRAFAARIADLAKVVEKKK